MRIAIIDDELEQRNILQNMLEEYAADRKQAFEIVQNSSGINFVSDYKKPFDLIFLDIDMPHMDGIQTAKKLREIDSNALLIFITRMAQYAIHGYEVDAMDFLVKPVSAVNLYTKMDKVVRILHNRSKRISIVSDRDLIVLSVGDIYYIEGNNQYVIYHTVSGNYRVHTTLKKTEGLLGDNFARCNNSFIVNLSYVSRLGKDEVIVGDNSLPVSRSYRKSFWNNINRYLGV